jgi:hypothetical protein
MTEAEQLDRLIERTRELPDEAAVEEVRDFFRTLSAEAARALADSRPEDVGQLEGAPPQLRYHANHLILVAAHQRFQAVVESGKATREQRTRFDTLDEMLRPLGKRIDDDGNGNRVERPLHRQFLLVEPEGQGRMIEVLGDLEEARNIAVLVPGMNNTLDKVRSQMDRAEAIKAEAGPGTAMVVWLGYYAPLALKDAMYSEKSRAAAPFLCRFHAGLDVVKAPDAKTTLIGNSYGAQVVGRALLAGVRADRVLLTGSPGVDPSVHSAAQITPPGTLLFVARTPGDYVSYAQQHGPDPADFPDVFRIETNRGEVKIGGHMSYFRNNSESLRNVGRIIKGHLAGVSRAARTTPEQESRLLPGVSWAEPLRRLAASNAAAPISKAFDGLAAFKAVSLPAKKKALDGKPNRRDGGTTKNRPEGPAR